MARSASAKRSERLGHSMVASGRLAMRLCALRKPARDARHGFAHVVGRARVAETDIPVPMHRIEVYARRRRDMGLLQHLSGEIQAVGGEFRNIGIEIEGAVGG